MRSWMKPKISSFFEKTFYQELASSSCFKAYFENSVQNLGPPLPTFANFERISGFKKGYAYGTQCPSSITDALQYSGTCILPHKTLELHYNQKMTSLNQHYMTKEATRYKLREVDDQSVNSWEFEKVLLRLPQLIEDSMCTVICLLCECSLRKQNFQMWGRHGICGSNENIREAFAKLGHVQNSSVIISQMVMPLCTKLWAMLMLFFIMNSITHLRIDLVNFREKWCRFGEPRMDMRTLSIVMICWNWTFFGGSQMWRSITLFGQEREKFPTAENPTYMFAWSFTQGEFILQIVVQWFERVALQLTSIDIFQCSWDMYNLLHRERPASKEHCQTPCNEIQCLCLSSSQPLKLCGNVSGCSKTSPQQCASSSVDK